MFFDRSSDHPILDELLSTETKVTSALTRDSLSKLQRQDGDQWDARMRPKPRFNLRLPSVSEPKRRRSLSDYSVYQRMELMDELIVCLGQCYPRWKHRRFGLQRFYCHKFNIYLNLAATENYVKLLSNLWDGFESSGVDRWITNNMWLQLLTQEYQVHTAKHNSANANRKYSNSKRVEEVLQQLDEITSCFCSDRCAMDFMRHSSYWGIDTTTSVRSDSNLDGDIIGDCFAASANIKKSENAPKIPAIVSFYEERGMIHNFTRPYEYGVEVVPIDGFKRSVVCLSCGHICWCSCQRKLFRTQKSQNSATEDTRVTGVKTDASRHEVVDGSMLHDDGTDEEEITDMHDFVNSLEEKKQSIHPNIAHTAITVAHSRHLTGGVVHCYTGDVEGDHEEHCSYGDLKHQILRARSLRGGIDELFAAISPRKEDTAFITLPNEPLEAWRTVPSYRSWRHCWWRHVDMSAVDLSDNKVKPFVSRALERLDALGNVRYNLEYGFIAVGYIQKKYRSDAYWRHFYVSKLGLWRAFTKAAEYNILVSSLPLELQLDVKSSCWTVCKCHQGDMFRKSFSIVKRGMLTSYMMAVAWYEKLLKELGLVSADGSDMGDESDVGLDEFDERKLFKGDLKSMGLPTTVEHSYLSARKRKIVLAGERKFDIASDRRATSVSKEQYKIRHNLWVAELRDLLPGLYKDLPMPGENTGGQTLRNLLAQYPELKDYVNISVRNLEECVYTLKMYVNNSAERGTMDLVEPLMQMVDKKLSEVIPQVPMQWVSYHKISDSWTCILECNACISCPPVKCLHKETCTKFKSGRKVIDLLCKKFAPCSVKYSQDPFHNDNADRREAEDNCCIVGFTVHKFGFHGAKALATEFRKRYIQLVYSSTKYDGSFTETLLGMIAEEIGLLTSTDAYILPKPSTDTSDRVNIEALSCGVCSAFGDRMQHRNGTVLLKTLMKSNVPYERLCEVFALGQIAKGILDGADVDINFCNVHMAWVAWWKDCMEQRRVMFYRVEDLIGIYSLEDALNEFDKHWTDAMSSHVEHTARQMADRYQLTLVCQFEEAFHYLTGLQKNLYDAFHTAFAMAMRAIVDSRQEFKLLKRLCQLNRNEPGDIVAQEVHAQSFALTDALLFPFGSMHDEGTPPLSETE
eukprot:XP_001611916.1 hypothetical protein [Babesia bovis T2Bo]